MSPTPTGGEIVPEILPEILRFLSDYLGMPDVGPDTDLFAAGIDSIQVGEVATFLDLRFAVAIPARDVTTDAFGTPARIAELVRRLQGGGLR